MGIIATIGQITGVGLFVYGVILGLQSNFIGGLFFLVLGAFFVSGFRDN